MTNEVVEAVAKPAAKVGGKVVAGLGAQVNEGKELWDQVVAWVAEKGVDFAINVAVALVILLVGAIAIRLIKVAVEKALAKANRGNSLFSKFICSVVTKTCWALLLMVFLQRLGINVTPLIAGLGVTGFILGFAFQESLGNLASGMMIAINEPFKVGDYINAGGIEGSVRELNMMATILTTPDNKKVVLPNKSVWGSPITNYSAMETRRVDMAVGIAYGSDIGRAKDVAVETLRKIPGVLDDPAPMAEVSKLDNSSVLLTVRAWSKNADYWSVYFAAQQQVKEAFDSADISIPFPQLTVHMDK